MWTSNPNFASLLIRYFPIVVKNLAPIDKERGRSIHGMTPMGECSTKWQTRRESMRA